MAKQLLNFFNNTKGLNTDASPFLQPEGTSIVLKNYVPTITGRNFCRKGLLEETGSSPEYNQIATRDDIKYSTYSWTNAYNNNSFIIVRAGSELYFYRDGEQALRDSQDYYFKLDLTKYQTLTDGDIRTTSVSLAPTNGALYVCGEFVAPFYLRAYDDGTFEEQPLEIYEREFNGFREDYADRSTRPVTLTEDLLYSLINRGWSAKNIKAFFDEAAVYPSLTDNPEYGYYDNPTTGEESWKAKQVVEENTGYCPEGHIIKRVFDYGEAGVIFTDSGVDPKEVKDYFYTKYRDLGNFTDALVATRSAYPVTSPSALTASGNPNRIIEILSGNFTPDPNLLSLFGYFIRTSTKTALPPAEAAVVNGSEYPVSVYSNHVLPSFSTNAMYAGRVWWAGSKESNNSGKLYYSQTLDDFGKASACHSEADPTSRKVSEVIDSDGGTISINNIGDVLKLYPYGNSMILFATNGIWNVTGRDGIFTATDYAQSKIGNHVLVGPEAVVEIGGALFFWATSGIFVLTSDGGQVIMKTISDGTVSNFLSEIPLPIKQSAQMAYDKTDKIVYVTYGDNKMFCLDFRMGALYPLETTSDVIFKTVVQHEFVEGQQERIKYYTIRNVDGVDRYVWTTYSNDERVDITSNGPVPVEASMVTSFVVGDAVRLKGAPYVYVFMDNDPETDTSIRLRMDYTVDELGSKWSPWESAFGSASPSFAIVKRKIRLPGMGRAFAFEFNSIGKPSSIVGWAVEMETVDNT